MHSLVKFLQSLSHIADPVLGQLNQAASPIAGESADGRFSRIGFSSPGVKNTLRRFYGREDVHIQLAIPRQRSTADLLKFSKLEAYARTGGQVGAVIPLTLLDEEMVDALHADLRQQLLQSGSKTPLMDFNL